MSPATALESLITLNNQLELPEAAVGILKYAQSEAQGCAPYGYRSSHRSPILSPSSNDAVAQFMAQVGISGGGGGGEGGEKNNSGTTTTTTTNSTHRKTAATSAVRVGGGSSVSAAAGSGGGGGGGGDSGGGATPAAALVSPFTTPELSGKGALNSQGKFSSPASITSSNNNNNSGEGGLEIQESCAYSVSPSLSKND